MSPASAHRLLHREAGGRPVMSCVGPGRGGSVWPGQTASLGLPRLFCLGGLPATAQSTAAAGGPPSRDHETDQQQHRVWGASIP